MNDKLAKKKIKFPVNLHMMRSIASSRFYFSRCCGWLPRATTWLMVPIYLMAGTIYPDNWYTNIRFNSGRVGACCCFIIQRNANPYLRTVSRRHPVKNSLRNGTRSGCYHQVVSTNGGRETRVSSRKSTDRLMHRLHVVSLSLVSAVNVECPSARAFPCATNNLAFCWSP
jgi:hypothetical protein